jgi:putative DNA primase/helicase
MARRGAPRALPAQLKDAYMITDTQNIRDLKQWVCWRYEERDGKPTKVPYGPLTREKADSTDPETWASYEEAVSSHREHGYDGIGFVFTPEDELCGIDLDGCLDPETGEIEGWAQDIIEELDSYAEISPRGTGVHVLVRGTLPPGRNRKGQFEAYDRARYFTVTGRHLAGTPRSIEGRQDQLERVLQRVFGEPVSTNGHKTVAPEFASQLSDEEIIEKASTAANGEKFRRLLAGDSSDYSSPSEADQAFCSSVAFWTGPDPGQIDRLFRQSGLYREKWERRDYRERTIARALDGRTEFYRRGQTVKLKSPNGSDNTNYTDNTISAKLPDAPPFPVDAMPPPCRRFVHEAAESIGCQPDLVAIPVLSLLSAGVGNSRRVEIKRGWRESATLFTAVVKAPGEKKTPAAKAALSPVWKKQVDLKREYREKRKVYEEGFRQWEADKKVAAKNGEIAPPRPQEPVMGRVVVDDTTIEALAGILESNPRGVLVARDELAGWVRAMDQYKSGKGADRQNWLSLWSNAPISVDRKSNAEPVIVESPWVSVTGSIQPEILPDLSDGREDGLLDRFLFAYPEPYYAPLSAKEISATAESELRELYERLASVQMPESNGEPFPGTVPLAPGSWEAFKSLADSLTAEMYELGFPMRLAGAWRKLEGYLARLALILCVSRVAGSGAREQIEPQDIRAAGRLIDYFKAHAKRVQMGLRGQNPRDRLATELREFLGEHGGEWEGEPNELHEELVKRGSEAVPSRPDELSKTVLDIGNHSASLVVGRAWRKHDGKSRRILKLLLTNGVDGVDGVDPETASDYTDNADYTNFQQHPVDPPGADNTVYTDKGINGAAQGQPMEKPVQCGHGYPRGKGCYLCDPNHPYRLKEGATA